MPETTATWSRTKGLTREIAESNEATIDIVAAVLKKFGTLTGAAEHLGVHRSTIRRAISTNKKLLAAWQAGVDKKKEEADAARDELAKVAYADMTAELDATQAKINKANERLNKDYLKLYANDITKILNDIKELIAERSKIKARMSAKFYQDGTPRT